jgi:hypothetical protein
VRIELCLLQSTTMLQEHSFGMVYVNLLALLLGWMHLDRGNDELRKSKQKNCFFRCSMLRKNMNVTKVGSLIPDMQTIVHVCLRYIITSILLGRRKLGYRVEGNLSDRQVLGPHVLHRIGGTEVFSIEIWPYLLI